MNAFKTPIKMPVAEIDSLSFLNGMQTRFTSIAQMMETRANEIPDRPHLLYDDQTVTYAQTHERAGRVAGFLARQKIQKGAVVSLMIMNAPEIFYCMLGAVKAGAIAGSINFALKGPEIAYVLDDSKPRVVFVGSEFMDEFSIAMGIASHHPLIVEATTDTRPQSPLAAACLQEILDTAPVMETFVPQNIDDPFLLLYSSGTTGHPKGIILTHKGQLSICRDMARLGLVTGGDTMLILLPMFHTNPICVWSFPMTFCGQTLCIRKAFSPQDFWPAILDNGITILMGVPAMYAYVYSSTNPATLDRSKLKLKWAFCGAAPLSTTLIKGFKDKFNVDIIEGYGLTEATGVSTANPPLGNRKPGSIGLPMREQEVAILDDDQNPLAAGEKGEICIRGDATMQSYLNNPEGTSDTLKNGWLLTGDIGYMDPDGYFYVVDRKKDMINRGGENIYPREIEMVLEKHPGIAAVAVVGIPDQALGERVKAVLELTKPGSLSPEEIQHFLSDKLARYKIPEHIEIMDQIPRNPTGKILKTALR